MYGKSQDVNLESLTLILHPRKNSTGARPAMAVEFTFTCGHSIHTGKNTNFYNNFEVVWFLPDFNLIYIYN